MIHPRYLDKDHYDQYECWHVGQLVFQNTLLKRDINGLADYKEEKVYLVGDSGEPVLLDEASVWKIDQMRVKNVNVVLSPYTYDPANNKSSLYIRTMYVEQDLDDDPYAARYRGRRNAMVPDEDDDMPF